MTVSTISGDFTCFKEMQNMNDQQLGEMMKTLLLQLVDYGASDLHISANSLPFIRRNLKIERISDTIITPEYAEKLMSSRDVCLFRYLSHGGPSS